MSLHMHCVYKNRGPPSRCDANRAMKPEELNNNTDSKESLQRGSRYWARARDPRCPNRSSFLEWRNWRWVLLGPGVQLDSLPLDPDSPNTVGLSLVLQGLLAPGLNSVSIPRGRRGQPKAPKRLAFKKGGAARALVSAPVVFVRVCDFCVNAPAPMGECCC